VTEDERIARIAVILGAREIGDDAAVLAPSSEALVWTIDEQVERVHFRRDLCSFEDIGWRATMAAASDLAAMGARPLGALAAIVVPADIDDAALDAIARGQREACDVIGAKVVGGNLSRGDTLSIATTWLGSCERPMLRSGARVGDTVYVIGALGLASAGFKALSSAKTLDAPAEAITAWRRPRARITDGLRIASSATSCIDVSDGLAIDAGRIARASGVRVALDGSALRRCLHSATNIEDALGGGEDYALLFTSASPALEGATRIGVIESGVGVTLDGVAVSGGFDHFANHKP
jgi:thiamine-monophosphate kinase